MRCVGWVIRALGVVLLAGCGSSNEDGLRLWMLEQKNEMRPRVPPIAEPKPFKPADYEVVAITDPYAQDKLTSVLKRDTVQKSSTSNALITREQGRRKEVLETFPLDTMAMVGSLLQEGQPAALIRVDKLLYQVRLGNHMGLNYGRVTNITESEVTLREIVQDSVGEWIERPATLQLQERAK